MRASRRRRASRRSCPGFCQGLLISLRIRLEYAQRCAFRELSPVSCDSPVVSSRTACSAECSRSDGARHAVVIGPAVDDRQFRSPVAVLRPACRGVCHSSVVAFHGLPPRFGLPNCAGSRIRLNRKISCAMRDDDRGDRDTDVLTSCTRSPDHEFALAVREIASRHAEEARGSASAGKSNRCRGTSARNAACGRCESFSMLPGDLRVPVIHCAAMTTRIGETPMTMMEMADDEIGVRQRQVDSDVTEEQAGQAAVA